MNKPKVQYSKVLPIIAFVLFGICLYKGFTADMTNVYDVSIYATAITVSGSMCLTAIVFYMKNSQCEKVALIKSDTYRIASTERLKYNEAMLELKRKYNYTEEEILDIENDSPMDDFEDSALNSLNNSIDSAMDEASSPIEIQNV